MTPNQLNRRVVADWLLGTSETCSRRSVVRTRTGNMARRKRSLVELRWRHAGGESVFSTVANSRAEATAKAAAWIRRKGWEASHDR